ncbi:MAG: hypothetical protein KatS3mg015_2529 [Fimbriimonadales bacterium]|nr:MAG: hypothetical protein KatS3mg015_2529 [Fimbriimonadales bacterium]
MTDSQEREPYLADPDVTLWVGDALEVLRSLPDESVDCAATSPPFYGLRDYGIDGQIGLEATPEEWRDRLVEVFREVRRVLAPYGTLWVECGDTYAGQRSYPHSLKPKDLIGAPFLLAFGLRDDGWWWRSVNVWCLSGGTKLYARTQNSEGPMALKDLARLDPSTVELWNGRRWTRVRGWYRSEVRDEPLEIELASGERVGCTPGHVWPTQRGLVRSDQLRVGDVLQTVRLPEPEDPDRPRFLPDDEIGYVVGRYLADGSMSGGVVQIACHANEGENLLNQVRPVALALHGSARLHRTSENTATVNVNGPVLAQVIRAYIHGSTAKTKGLRTRVWRRSDAFLLALLRGYLEGDGSYDESNDRYRLAFTRNDKLAGDLRTLAGRLGLPIRLALAHTMAYGKRWPIYRGQIRLTPSAHGNARADGRIVAIRRSRGRAFWDVEVADEPHVFALASGVLTHNSKPNCLPESVGDRPVVQHSYVFQFSKRPRYYHDAEAVREPAEWARWGDQTVIKRQQGKGSWIAARDKNELLADGRTHRSLRSVWTIPTEGFSGRELFGDDGRIPSPDCPVHGDRPAQTLSRSAGTRKACTCKYIDHFATWPTKLAKLILLMACPEQVCRECGKPRERIISSSYDSEGRTTNGPRSLERRHESPGFAVRKVKSTTTEGFTDCGHNAYRPGIVLDPFFGAGTTGVVARKLGRHCVGIELNESYCELAARRLAQQSIFAEQK